MQNSKKIALFLGDLMAIFGSFFISLRIGYLKNFTPEVYKTHIGPFLIIYAIWVIMLFAFELYEPVNQRPSMRSFKKISSALAISLLISLTFFYIFNIFGISPKTNLLINICVFAGLFITERRILTAFLANKFTEKVLLLGQQEYFQELKERIFSQKGGYYHIVKEVPSLTEEIIEEIKEKKFDIVIFSPHAVADELVAKHIQTFMESGVSFLETTKAYEKILGKIPHDQVDEIWFITNVQNNKNILYEFTKRCIEVTLSVFGLIILSPILLIVFILLKIQDGGPFLYSQIRTGFNGNDFKIYKIRSMIIDSEKNGAEWAKTNDARITPIGKFLRNSHLDESMQLINILKGEISFVGPRPERPEFIKNLVVDINNYNLRHIVKPGITGWAQINYKYGNSVEDSRQKFEYDLFYVKNRNFFLDIGIIVRTIQKIFFK